MLNTFVNILILLALGIGTPTLCVGVLSLFKIKINKNVQTYLYAFTAGLIIILGTVGFIAEAINHAKEQFSTTNHDNLNAIDTLKVIGVVVGGGIIGVLIVILSRYIFTISNGKKGDFHDHHHDHNHADFLYNASDIDNKTNKWLPIILLLGHRLVDGIVLGFMANTANNAVAQFDNWGMIIVFIIHLIPTSIIIYLIQLDIQNNHRFKSFLITTGILTLMIPFTILGGFLINVIESIWWLMPLLYSISGSLMTLAGILEIIPEFIHYRNASIKQWIYTTSRLGTGITLATLLITIHSH